MAGVDSTTWTRGYTYRDNKLNTSSNTGYSYVNEGKGTKWNYDNPRYSLPGTGPSQPRGGTPDYGSPGNGGGASGSSHNSYWEDAYKKYVEALQKTRDEAMAYRKGLYEDALANNLAGYKDEQRLANREYYTRNRRLNELYGNGLSGSGLSNRFASSSMLTNALTNAKNRQNSANRTAEAEYHNALSNINAAYNQGMYNAFGTEYGIDRNLEYQRYLLEHGDL